MKQEIPGSSPGGATKLDKELVDFLYIIMDVNSVEINNVELSEELYPSKNLKRQTYKSPMIKIITETSMDDTDDLGFPKNDLPDYV